MTKASGKCYYVEAATTTWCRRPPVVPPSGFGTTHAFRPRTTVSKTESLFPTMTPQHCQRHLPGPEARVETYAEMEANMVEKNLPRRVAPCSIYKSVRSGAKMGVHAEEITEAGTPLALYGGATVSSAQATALWLDPDARSHVRTTGNPRLPHFLPSSPNFVFGLPHFVPSHHTVREGRCDWFGAWVRCIKLRSTPTPTPTKEEMGTTADEPPGQCTCTNRATS